MSSTTAPAAVTDPPRRAFGQFPKQPIPKHPGPPARPSSSSSFDSSRSNTPTLGQTQQSGTIPASALFLNPPPEPQRTRSASSASTEAFETAATKASTWLQTWAPYSPYKGEGRGREFLSNTLNGVAGVASTVSHGINGAVTKGVQLSNDRRTSMSRPASFSGPPSSHSQTDLSVPTVPPPTLNGGSALATSPPAGPTHTSSTSAVPSNTNRRIPQPANFARLGAGGTTSPPLPDGSSSLRPTATHSVTSPAVPNAHRRTSSGQLPVPAPTPHGPSNLNPYHVRTGSTSHARSPSFGAPISQGLSRSSSAATGGRSTTGKSLGMPYKAGFQPAGVRNDRSEEFQDARRYAGEERDKEEGRLGRRWAKLVDLHFNPTLPNPAPTVPTLSRSSSSSFSLSSTADKRKSFLSIDGALDALKGPRDVWKGVKTNLGPGGGPGGEIARKRGKFNSTRRLRADDQPLNKRSSSGRTMEMRVNVVYATAFGLSNRKHHCRLCGRLVCSLPPTPPALLAVQVQLFSPNEATTAKPPLPPGTRTEKCSLLLVADWKTGRGEEVDEGFVGWMKVQDGEETLAPSGTKDRRKSRLSTSSVPSAAANDVAEKDAALLPQQPREVQVRGVRSCKECWAVVSRKQKIADRQRVNGFARLYQMLRNLQHEIEDTMPDFEEQMDLLTSLPEPEAPSAEILAIHKQLLTLFAQYEHLSKRLSSLPVEEGSSQSTVQSAVARTAATFLAKEMIKVQALPKLQKRVAELKRQGLGTVVLETTLAEQLTLEGVDAGQAVDFAVVLQPLLEQEAQLEHMIADANAQRKYEDSKALGVALEEIRAEIANVTNNAIA